MRLIAPDIYMIERNKDKLEIGLDLTEGDLAEITTKHRPLYWDNDGRWGLFTDELLQHTYQLLRDYSHMSMYGRPAQKPKVAMWLLWSQVIPIRNPKLIERLKSSRSASGCVQPQ
jgi:hypothetical protein